MRYGELTYSSIFGYKNDKQYTFNSIEEAAKKTGVSEKRILACIKNGQKWKTWSFDYYYAFC